MNIKELNNKRINLWLDQVGYLHRDYGNIFTTAKFVKYEF